MKFNVNMAHGSKLGVEVGLPGIPTVSGPARRRIVAQLDLLELDDRNAALVRRRRDAYIANMAPQLEPYLPPASPAIKRVQTIEDGGTSTTRTSYRPAIPPPAQHAWQMATALAAHVEKEERIGLAAQAQAVQAAARPALAATVRNVTAHLDARLAELEGKRD